MTFDQTRLERELVLDEGLNLEAYRDHLGNWTIGVGRAFVANPLTPDEVIEVLKTSRLSREGAYFLLRSDIKRKLGTLYESLPWLNDLSDARQRALANMAYQLGVPGLLKFQPTLTLIRAGRWQEAAARLRKSLWYSQTPNRAERVISLLLTG
jgi:lysozyme